MKKNLYFVLAFSLLFTGALQSQPIGMGDSCHIKNTATFAKVFLDLAGDDFVSDFLASEHEFVMLFKIDAQGHVKKHLKTLTCLRNNTPLFPKSLSKKITKYLADHEIVFCKCCDRLVGKTEEESLLIYQQKLVKKGAYRRYKRVIWVGLPFYFDLPVHCSSPEIRDKPFSDCLKIWIDQQLNTEFYK